MNKEDNGSQIEGFARIVLDNMFHFAGLLDRYGKIKYINRPALEAVDQNLDALIGLNFWDAPWFKEDEDGVEFQNRSIKKASEGSFVRADVEIFVRRVGKETIITDYSLTPIYDDNNQVIFLLAEGRDITDKKNLEMELEEKNKSLEVLVNKNKDLSEQQKNFFSNLSHELKTPLSLIIGNVDLMISGQKNLELTPELSSIRKNSISMLTLVEEMLELARLDNSRLDFKFKNEMISEIISQVISNFYSLANYRNIKIHKDIKDDVISSVDISKFKKILMNLISNAFNVIPDGGMISCTLSKKGANHFEIKVIDTGPGIPDHLKSKIFERFQTGGHQYVTGQSSTGLGLAIVKEYCNLHGGDISVCDSLPYGTEFRLTFPIHECADDGDYVTSSKDVTELVYSDSNSKSQSTETNANIEGDGYVLVVDDNVEITEVISRALERIYNVRVCFNGLEALRKVKEEKPLLVLTDLMMPVMDGLTLINQIKNDDRLSDLPIIVLSAKKDESARVNLLSGSVNDYITKPFFIPELLSRVRNTVELYKAKKNIQKELSSHNNSLVGLIDQLIEARNNLQKSIDSQKIMQYRMNAIYNSSNIGIAIIDESYRFVDANPYLCELLGYTHDEIVDHNLIDITYKEDEGGTIQLLDSLIAGDLEHYNHEKRFVSKNGSIIWTNASAFSVPSDKNNSSLLIDVIQDVTEKISMQQSLEQSRKDVEHFSRVSTVNEFASSIAHELNQPLSAIISNSKACGNWLEKYNITQEQVRYSLDLIKSDAIRSSEIISSIRGFIKKSYTEYQDVYIGDLLSDICVIINAELRSHDIHFDRSTLFDNVKLNVDVVSIKQVFLNLILNAIQALSTYVSNDKYIYLDVRCDYGVVFFSVNDNGPGISDDLINNLFKPFMSSKREGLGLGLSICRGILEQHHSDLKFSNNTPSGAIFSFSLSI